MGAMNMQMMARSLLVYRITGSAAALGVIALANSLPMLFFSLFGGVLADRVQKKYVLIAGQVGSAILAFIIALFLYADILGPDQPNSWWILVGYSLVAGALMGVVGPAQGAILPQIVGEERLMNAVALNMLGMNFLRLTAPAIAGFFIEAFGFEAIYFSMTGLYLLGLVFFILMPSTGTMSIGGQGALSDMEAGFQYVRRERTILLILALTLVFVVLSMPYMFLLPVFTESILKVGAQGMGILMSVSGIGAVAGSIVLASLPNKKRGLMFLIGSAFLGVALTAFAFSSQWTLSLIMVAFVGLGQTLRMTLSNTLLQYYVDDQYRGRVTSIYNMEFGLSSFGVFFAGIMATIIGVQWAVGGLAIILIVMALLFLAVVPRIRNLN
jgi:MFS family permease